MNLIDNELGRSMQIEIDKKKQQEYNLTTILTNFGIVTPYSNIYCVSIGSGNRLLRDGINP